jgi:hypothetical protein
MASPTSALIAASRKGKSLYVPRSASLPPFCLKCGEPATKPWRKKFFWHPPAYFLLILFPGIVIYAIVAMLVRKQMELNLPICDLHLEDRKRYKLLALLFFIAFVPVGLLLGNYFSEALGWVTGAAMMIASFAFYIQSQLGIASKKIDAEGGIFRGACLQFLDRLPEQF